jgi:NAD(P)-dependent dehydrogenase (short-subunit alcohol dehydrogenase family)
VADGPTKILTGQKALVTGANSGIGEAVAIALGEAGADVMVNYVTGEDRAEAVAEEIRRSGVRALPHKADVSDEAQVQEMFRRAMAELGTIDILVYQCRAAARCAVPHHERGAVEHGHRRQPDGSVPVRP